MRSVPAPLMSAPMALRQRAKSPISGSRAALTNTVSPRASDAAISRFSVAPTEGLAKMTSAPTRPFGARASI